MGWRRPGGSSIAPWGGVEIVVCDAHTGLVRALRRAFQGVVWQRCQVHFKRNVLGATPKVHHKTIEEGRRREKVIRIFPNDRSAWRLMGALVAEQHEEWITNRRYFDMTEYNEWKITRTGNDDVKKAA